MLRMMLVWTAATALIAGVSDVYAQATNEVVETRATNDDLRQQLEELRRQQAQIQAEIATIEKRLFHESADEGEIPEDARRAAGDHKLYALGELVRLGDLEVRLRSFDHQPREFSVTDHRRAPGPLILGLPMYAATITVTNTSQGRVAKPFREESMYSGLPEVVAQDNWENKLVGQSLSSVQYKFETTTSSGFELLGADVLPGETIDFLLPVEAPKVFNIEWFIVRVRVHHGDDSERIAFFVPVKAVANLGEELPVEDPGPGDTGADVDGRADGDGGAGIAVLGDRDADGGGASFFGIEATGNRFAYLVDVSGSMEVGCRIEALRSELNTSLTGLSETSSFFVCLFSGGAGALGGDVKWTDATARGKSNARTFISRIAAGGGTNPTPGFQMIFTLRPRPDAIYFMTDGQFAEDAIVEIERLNRNRRVPIHCITFGSDEGEAMMRYIARRSGGTYRHVPELGSEGGR